METSVLGKNNETFKDMTNAEVLEVEPNLIPSSQENELALLCGLLGS